jgi:flavin-dependent dehydrogenase
MKSHEPDLDRGHTAHDFQSLIESQVADQSDEFALKDGHRIAVIGGGPAGSFFSYFALRMARMMGREIEINIFEPKNFLGTGPAGCNHCGGVISELMVQSLAVEGINIPTSVVQRGINSYQLYTERGDVRIETPANEKTIASVYRSGGPKDLTIQDKDSFDNFLLQSAVREGAQHVPRAIDRVVYEDGRPTLYGDGDKLGCADLVVGAFGVNGKVQPSFDGMDFGYRSPTITRTSIAEIALDPIYINEKFGNSIHLFLLPIKNIKFAAIIPKSSYVNLCMMGKKLDRKRVQEFLHHPKVRQLFPEGELENLSCMCLPFMNISAPSKPFTDRVVMIGDAGSTRLYKDGIGAAYFMAKSAAKTVLMHGVGEEHFQKYFMPDYKSLISDNRYGSLLFMFTDLFREYRLLTSIMIRVVKNESEGPRGDNKILSSILWDMFTGNERYRDVFYRALRPELTIKLIVSTFRQVFGV